jgi:endonuclease/exonuclease/phosphatase family metal-dependent hydrolase
LACPYHGVADLEARISDMPPRLTPRTALAAALLTATPAAAGEPLERLAVASYNVQFATPDMPLLSRLVRELPGHKPNVAARATAIGAALACFDVIALQETVNDRRRAEILATLQRHGRDCGQPARLAAGWTFAFLSGPPLPDDAGLLPLVDDELALASRLPIIASHTLTFTDSAGEDALAAKGVLHARLARAAGDELDVYVSHLQAGHEHAAVRRGQIAQLAAFIRDTAAAQGPVLVMGDLNLWGGTPDRADPASEYNRLMAALDAAVAPRRFVDLWLATHPHDAEIASGTKPRMLEDGSRRPREKRIDYLLLARDRRRRSRCVMTSCRAASWSTARRWAISPTTRRSWRRSAGARRPRRGPPPPRRAIRCRNAYA